MGSVDDIIAREMLARGIDLLRLDAGTQARIRAILDRMEDEIVAKLARDDLTAFNRARLDALLVSISDVIDKGLAQAQGELALAQTASVPVIASQTAGAIQSGLSGQLGIGLPTASYLERLSSNVLTQGAVTADWWGKLALDTAFRVATQLRQGLAQGETNQQIIYRLTGKMGQRGVLETTKASAAAVVQTTAQTVANAARMKTFEANADIIVGVRWLATLDSHTCETCAARDGLSWTNSADGEHDPIGHSIPFEAPPIHWNDRCVMTPVTKSWQDMGIDMPGMSGVRASSQGPVKMSFDEWFKGRTPAQQDEQFGPGRAQMFRDGEITTRQMVDMTGHPLSLAELKARYE
jgi:hypothetical protein